MYYFGSINKFFWMGGAFSVQILRPGVIGRIGAPAWVTRLFMLCRHRNGPAVGREDEVTPSQSGPLALLRLRLPWTPRGPKRDRQDRKLVARGMGGVGWDGPTAL